MGEFALGQPVSRFEDSRLLRGGGRYVADMVLPRMAFGHVLRSLHAHARIRAIDTSKAKSAPGVLAVLTGADWEASGWGDLPVPTGMKRRDGSPSYKPRYPALVTDRVRWIGDYVAFIVAETAAQAADAAELIEVDYEPLPAIVSTAGAVEAGAPLVWDDCPNNICFVHFEGDKAKTEAAFAQAAHVIRHRLVVNRVTAASMEPRACIGDYSATEGRYTIYTTLQRTHTYRAELAEHVLRVPESKVRVVAGDIGGSFGMKTAVYNETALVLLAAKLTGRPVKWTGTRSEAFLGDAQARDNVTDAELALDQEGKFLGLKVKTVVNIGAYAQTGSQVFVGNLGTLAGVYRTPAIHADVTAVFSNMNPVRPYRGNGRREAAYVIERMVELAADDLGIAPYHGFMVLNEACARPPLATGKVRFAGEPVAVVVAESLAAAQDAAGAGVVHHQPLPAPVDLEAALAPAAPLLALRQAAPLLAAGKAHRRLQRHEREQARPVALDGHLEALAARGGTDPLDLGQLLAGGKAGGVMEHAARAARMDDLREHVRHLVEVVGEHVRQGP